MCDSRSRFQSIRLPSLSDMIAQRRQAAGLVAAGAQMAYSDLTVSSTVPAEDIATSSAVRKSSGGRCHEKQAIEGPLSAGNDIGGNAL